MKAMNIRLDHNVPCALFQSWYYTRARGNTSLYTLYYNNIQLGTRDVKSHSTEYELRRRRR